MTCTSRPHQTGWGTVHNILQEELHQHSKNPHQQWQDSGIEHWTVLFPTEVSSFDFQVECTGRTVQYKLNAQSLRLFGLHRDVNDAHRAGANRLQNKTNKTQVWNAAGIWPPACDQLERIAQLTDPDAGVWKGSGLPNDRTRGPHLGNAGGPPRLRPSVSVERFGRT